MSDKFVRGIAKKLNCSKGKREEISKQIAADIQAEQEDGAKYEEIIRRMGSAREIADGFNSTFSDVEKKKYRKEKWLRRGSIIAVIVIILAILIYWALPKSVAMEDSKVFSKEAVQKQAQYVIELVGQDDYETLNTISNDKMQTVMTEDTWKQAKGNFGSDWGNFKSYGNSYIGEISQMGTHMAVVQINAVFDHASVTFTISFDKDMKLAGLYMK